MKLYFILICINLSILFSHKLENKNFYNYTAVAIDGDTLSMNIYKGKKILIVNVASKCGYTYQYEQLQTLQSQFADKLVILGFPSNDFFWQEPGSNQEIKLFCQVNYGVTFQLFEKTHVKGKNQHPIYNWLSNSQLNGWNNKSPGWNFYKYLIDETGMLVEYFKSDIIPTDSTIIKHIMN